MNKLLAALAAVLIVFAAAFCIPLLNFLLTLYNGTTSGLFLGSPALSFASLYFLFIDGAFLAIVISVAWIIIQEYRSRPGLYSR
jgi:hypothetical protein